MVFEQMSFDSSPHRFSTIFSHRLGAIVSALQTFYQSSISLIPVRMELMTDGRFNCSFKNIQKFSNIQVKLDLPAAV